MKGIIHTDQNSHVETIGGDRHQATGLRQPFRGEGENPAREMSAVRTERAVDWQGECSDRGIVGSLVPIQTVLGR
jgi:hypothetical protein